MKDHDRREITFVTLAILLVASRTWMTPVIESMMVVEIKKNLPRGAEDTLTFSYFWYTMGAAFYALGGGIIWKILDSIGADHSSM